MSKDWGNSGSHEERQTTFRYYGQVDLLPGVFAFIKGQGAVPFDASIHPASRRAECVEVKIYPVMEMKLDKEYSRRFTTGTREWIKIILESIEKLTGKTGNDALRAIDGKWVAVELVPTGKKYMSKPIYDDAGNITTPAEERNELAPKFIAVFEDDVKCGEAYDIFVGDTSTEDEQQTVDPARETALKFLQAMVASGMDVKPQFGTNPVLSCLTWEDEAVQAIVNK